MEPGDKVTWHHVAGPLAATVCRTMPKTAWITFRHPEHGRRVFRRVSYAAWHGGM